MENSTKKKKEIIKNLTPKTQTQDQFLVTICFTLIVSFIGLLSIPNNLFPLVKVFFLISILTLSISCFLLIWYTPRFKVRVEKWRKTLESILDQTVLDVRQHVRLYSRPTMLRIATDTIEKINNEKRKFSKEDIFKEIEKAMSNIDFKKEDEFLSQMLAEKLSFEMDFFKKKIFNEPLRESYSKSKHYIDILSKNTRYHFFIIGVTTFIFGIVTFLLTK